MILQCIHHIFSSILTGYWNVMDRFSEDHIRKIMERIRDLLISSGYDHSGVFVDGSTFYTYMR